MKGKQARAAETSPEELSDAIRRFLAECRDPALLEAGERLIPLQPGRYEVEVRNGRCVLHAWGEGGNVVRRMLAVERLLRRRLDLRAQRFGNRATTISLLDQAGRAERLDREAAHVQFREQLRRWLSRAFPEWTISQLTSAADLEHSLSPLYSRGALTRGQQAWAVIGASQESDAASCDGILTCGLIWLDLLRRRDTKRVFRGLKIFLPRSRTRTTANRLAHLRKADVRFELYWFDRQGNLQPVDERDYGNLATELYPCLPAPESIAPISRWVEKILENPAVETVPRPDGLLSLRVRGIQFALAGKGVLTAGLERLTPIDERGLGQVCVLARDLARFRSADAADTQNPLYRQRPESWLESQARRNMRAIDPALQTHPVYSHVPAIAGPDRGVIDLLACDETGRLAVLELKTGEDIHLPLQGLDYWMRVKWHLQREEFRKLGYFRGMELSPKPPRLLLVSPAFDFHPTTETLLSYFSPEVEVERVGISGDWRRELKVIFRKRGAARLA